MKTFYKEFSSKSIDKEHQPPMIFLHGMMESNMTWMIVGPLISHKTGRKAYFLDARNHGKSSWSVEMDYDVLTTDLKDFMDDFRIRKAIIIGHSMGGRTAINFALKYPERVEALIIEDMTPKNVKSRTKAFVPEVLKIGVEILKGYPPEMSIEDVKKAFLDFLINIAGDKYFHAEKMKEDLKAMVPIRKRGGTFIFEANVDAVSSMMNSDALVQDLHKTNLVYNGDALFLYGSKPFFMLGKDSTVTRLFPKAKIMKIEGASHMMHLDSPNKFVEVVSNFINNRSLQSSKY